MATNVPFSKGISAIAYFIEGYYLWKITNIISIRGGSRICG